MKNKYLWETIIKKWLEITIKKLMPIFIESTCQLWIELMKTYNQENIKLLEEMSIQGEKILKKEDNLDEFNLGEA